MSEVQNTLIGQEERADRNEERSERALSYSKWVTLFVTAAGLYYVLSLVGVVARFQQLANPYSGQDAATNRIFPWLHHLTTLLNLARSFNKELPTALAGVIQFFLLWIGLWALVTGAQQMKKRLLEKSKYWADLAEKSRHWIRHEGPTLLREETVINISEIKDVEMKGDRNAINVTQTGSNSNNKEANQKALHDQLRRLAVRGDREDRKGSRFWVLPALKMLASVLVVVLRDPISNLFS